MTTRDIFKVGLTRDLLNGGGEPSFGTAPLALLDDAAHLDWEFIPESVDALTPELLARYDAIYVNTPKVTALSFGDAPPRVKIIARHGVGYDSVDALSLTARGVLLTNTPMAVRRPVATMTMTFVLALAQKLMTKDRLTRTGHWDERNDHMGQGLTGKVIGVIGAGSIGLECIKLARAFDMEALAADPFVDAGIVAQQGGTLVTLDALLQRSDFVVVVCLLNEATRHLINAQRLAQMKPSAYLINVARGSIVDEAALIDALRRTVIAGAALDVFEQEPVIADNPLLAMDNVILTPHALCWTDECFDGIARSGLGAIVDMFAHRTPPHVVNRDVLTHPDVKRWFDNPRPQTPDLSQKLQKGDKP